MNKGVLVALIFVYLSVVVIVANSFNIGIDSNFVGGIDSTNIDTDITIWSLLGTFFKMLSFQTTLPPIVNLLLIYPPIIILSWFIVEILKDLVPFT